MKQMFRLILVSLLAGLWFSIEDALCKKMNRGGYTLCLNSTSGQICFTTFLANNSLPVRMRFKEASSKCKSSVPGSSLIVINSLESQRNVESFIGRDILKNQTIFAEAQKLSKETDKNWSWVNGHLKLPNVDRSKSMNDAACVKLENGKQLAYCYDNVSSLFRYICEYSDSRSHLSFRLNNRSYKASVNSSTWFDARTECLRLGGDLAYITNLTTIGNLSKLEANQKYWIGLYRNKWIWNSTGAAVSYTNWEGGHPGGSSGKQCICIGETGISLDRKWRACNCSHRHAVVCQTEEKSVSLITQVAATDDFQSTAYFPIDNSTDFHSSSLSSSSSPPPSSSSPSSTATTTTTKTTTKIKASKQNSTKTALTMGTSPKSNDSKSLATSTFKTTPTNSTIFTAVNTRPTTHIAMHPDTTADGKAVSTLSITETTETPKKLFSEKQTTTFQQPSGLFNPRKTEGIILNLLLFVTIAFIVAAVIVVIRKRLYDRRNEESSTKNTNQNETVPSEYATVAPVNTLSAGATTPPPGNTTYSDVEMTQRPTPSDNTIYASVKPTGDAVDLGKSVDYADLDFPRKSQQKPRSADKITACLSPIYAQPFEPTTSANSTEYAEPFKPGKTHSLTAPVIHHPNAAGDQQNVYSFAKEVPSGDPNVIYSEPVKTERSSASIGKEASMADKDIYQEAIEVKRGTGIGDDATQDPNVVYSEPIRPKSHNKS